MAHGLEQIENGLSDQFDRDRSDRRLIRAKLMVSELAEVLEALANRDDVALADGLTDLHYVVTGTSLTYNIPEAEVFEEVHASNMTKDTAQDAVVNHSGARGKDAPEYRPPDIRKALEAARAATGLIRRQAYREGNRLATRDGRRVGNATVVDVSEDKRFESIIYLARTEFGVELKITESEAADLFHVKTWDETKKMSWEQP